MFKNMQFDRQKIVNTIGISQLKRTFGAFERKSPRGFSKDNPASIYAF